MLANSACASQRPERLLADDVWMFVYKVVMCPLKHSHDWEKCIYAHDGERARRRHPSMYQAIQCPEARAKKVCPRGEECPCTHHLFEYWLHPDRYMTCLCELGAECNRPICFFAHHEAELRPLPEGLSAAPNAMGSSRRRAAAAAAASAATAAAVQSERMPATGSGVGAQQSAMGMRQLSASSLTSSGGSQGTSLADSAAAGTYQNSSGASSSVSVLLQQQQAMASALAADSSHIRPGFSALGSIQSPANQSGGAFSSSYAAANTLKAASAPQQQQMASRAAAAGSHACPVLVLEAPPPMAISPQDSAQLQQAAQQFSQLNLTTAGSTWWLSPTASRAAQSNSNMSNMSLASSASSPVDMQGLAGADGVTFLASAGNSSTALMMDPLLLGRPGSVSPLSSALACSSPGINMLALDRASGLDRAAGQQQLQAGGLNVSRPIMAGVHQTMDDSPEHLSFSLWDMNAPGAQSGPPRHVLTQHLAQVPVPSSTAAVRMAGLDGFGGFASGRSSGGGSGRGAAAAAVLVVSSLASAAADRLLLAQQAGRLSAGSMGGGPGPVLSDAGQAGAGVDADTAREARLTLLRAWVNASTAAARGTSRSADGSLEQQEEQLLQASVDGGMGRVARLGSNGVAMVAQDLASVLTPADVLLLVQQLHGMLSN